MKALKTAWKVLRTAVPLLLLLCVLSYLLLLKAAPSALDVLFPYRGYTILTDSMVPTIPVGSLVVSKSLREGEEPTPGQIVTFEANHYGDDIILTHYLAQIDQTDDGARYRTRSEGATDFDNYETRREDLLGTYVFHVPYLGKFSQFIMSPYGLVMIVALLLIWLLNRFLKLQTGRGVFSARELKLRNLRFEPGETACSLTGELHNRSGCAVQSLILQVAFVDPAGGTLAVQTFDPLEDGPLEAGASRPWRLVCEDAPGAGGYRVESQAVTIACPELKLRSKKQPR